MVFKMVANVFFEMIAFPVLFISVLLGGGRVVQRCCVNFQCRSVLLIWMK